VLAVLERDEEDMMQREITVKPTVPILVGMKFKRKTDGSVWEVIEDRGFGRIEIFNKERTMFSPYTKMGIRQNYELVEVI
jgi:hypothetical protein